MKKSLSIILMILIGGFFAFTSCEEEETDTGTTPTAILKGTVYADLDLGNTGNEKVSAGKTIIFRIDAADLVLEPITDHTYQTLQYSTTTDADGNYSIELPTATHQGVPVDIQAVSFEDKQIQTDGSEIDKVYVHNGSFATLQDSEIVYRDLTYNSGSYVYL